MFFLLVLLSASYWYCLPVVTQNLLWYNEYRGYDLLLFVIGFVLLRTYQAPLKKFLAEDRPGHYFFYFSAWATATYPVTTAYSLISGNIKWSLVTVMYLFHLWGFFAGYAAFRMFVRNRRQCLTLLDFFLLIGAIEAVIICLQGLGKLPRFWSSRYDGYGTRSFSATLGPNRTLPGHAMILVLAVATAYSRNIRVVGGPRLLLALVAGTAAIAGLGISGSRTAWMAFLAFCAALVIASRPNFGALFFIAAVSVAFWMLVPESVKQSIVDVYEWRITGKLIHVTSDDPLEELKAVDAGRSDMWMEGLDGLSKQPWLVPFGGGFNNYRYAIPNAGVSAHCLYITLVGELGLVGLWLYLRWLFSVWRQTAQHISHGLRRSRRGERIFLPYEMRALMAALVVSGMGGEILYPYRPAFAFLGMVLFVFALLNHPRLVYAERSPGLPGTVGTASRDRPAAQDAAATTEPAALPVGGMRDRIR